MTATPQEIGFWESHELYLCFQILKDLAKNNLALSSPIKTALRDHCEKRILQICQGAEKTP